MKDTASAPTAKRSHDHRGNLTLAANFSATFNADGTQLTGELGSEAPVPPQNSAIVFSGPCKPTHSSTQQSLGDDHRGDDGKRDDHKGDDHRGGDDDHK